MALVKPPNIKSPITVNATGDTPITKTFIEWKSNSATGSLAATKIQYTFLGLSPSIGAVTKGGAPVFQFTQADLNSPGVINYTPDRSNKKTLDVVMRLRVTDLTDGDSDTFPVTIRYSLPDLAPEGSVGPLTVEEDGQATVTTAQINFVDLFDAPNAVFIEIQAWPVHGDMLFNGKLVGPSSAVKITMADVIAGKLAYKHNGDEATEDHLFFKVRDTKNKWSGITVGEQTEDVASVYDMPINIVLSDIPLKVVNKGPAEVVQCEEVTIGPELLSADDEDDGDLTLTWKLSKLPLHGILKKNGTPMTVGTTWTDSDISSGKITYEQDCSDTPVDTFEFSVEHSKEKLENVSFPIQLIKNLPPVIEINELQVEKCNTGIPAEVNIKITDPEGLLPKDIKLKYAPNTPETPRPKHGMIGINGKTGIPGVTEFTYADILAGNVHYIHDCTDHDPATDEWWFTVYDGGHEITVKLPIVIIFKDDLPPYLTQNVEHFVERNDEVSWKIDKLDFTDDDTEYPKVFFELVTLPEHGELFINGLPAAEGQKIARSDWDDIEFRYVAGAPDNSVTEDRAMFKLYDEKNTVDDLAIVFKFPPPPTVCPEVLNNFITTAYTLKKVISEIDMFASNEGIDSTEFVWTLKKAPVYGDLSVGTVKLVDVLPTKPDPADPPVANTWTSKDIEDMQFSYQHLRDAPFTDEFEFSVTNGFCAVQGKAIIKFIPGLNIDINKVLEVDQGFTPSVTPGLIDETYLLSSSGSVSDPGLLLYTVKTLPTVGTLYLDDYPVALSATSYTFSQQQINDGKLRYVPNDSNHETTEDLFKFEVVDGIEKREGVFKIKIKLLDTPPEIIINELVVGELTCGSILEVKHLKVEDDQSSPSELVFTLLSIPQYGELLKSNVPMAIGDTFTYGDVINGAMGYCETEEGALLDSFDFTLTDKGGNEVTPLHFPIKIIPPPPPELVNDGLTMEPCTVRAITINMLDVKNLRTTFNRAGMVFKVTKAPKHGVLSKGAVALAVGDTFTLADLLANTVTYTSISFKTDPDSFDFDVQSDVFTSKGNTFDIKLRAVNNPPWICVNTGMLVFEQETKAVTLDMLQMCDVDMDRDKIADFDPESAEDLSPLVYPLGEVINPSEVDGSGRINKDVLIEFPGVKYKFTFTVKAGSARAIVRDQNGATLASSICATSASGVVVMEFSPPVSSTQINCQVIENCVPGAVDPDWTFDLAKA